jgi:hypothetical protein
MYTQGTDRMIEYSLNILNKIHLNTLLLNESQTKLWRDFMKSITMKILQLALLYYHSEYEFVKEDLALSSEKLGFNPNNTLWFLFRGNEGEYEEHFIPQLFELYKTIVSLYYSNIKTINVIWPKSTLTNNTHITDILFVQFIESPNEPSFEFEQEFTRTYPTGEISHLFPIVHSNIDDLILPQPIKDKFIRVAQRSDEWLFLLT